MNGAESLYLFLKPAILGGILWGGYRYRQALPWFLTAMVADLLYFKPAICLTLTLGATIGLYRYHRPLRWPFNGGPLLVLFGVAVVTTLRTWGVGDSVEPLLNWVGFGLYYAVLTNGLTATGLAPARVGLAIGSMAAVMAGLLEYRRGDYVSIGFDWHQNGFAMVLNALFPLFLMGGLETPRTEVEGGLCIAAGAAMSASVLLTLSRTGLALSAGLLVLCGFRSLFPDVPSHRRQWLLLALVVVTGGWLLRWDAVDRRFADAPRSNGESRLAYAGAATHLMDSHPMGIGLEKFQTFERLPTSRSWLGYFPVARVHNVFLQVGAELGWVGLVVFVWVIVRFMLLTGRAIRYGRQPLYGTGLLLGQVALLLNNQVEPNMLQPPDVLIALFFAAAAQAVVSGRQTDQAPIQ